jgi:hypothetical protein
MSTSQISIDNSEVVIEVVDQAIRVMAIEHPNLIVLGDSGPQGPQGIPGEVQTLGYVYNQGSPSSEWTIVHGLDFVPNITVVDSAGSVVEGDYSYPDDNTVIATFVGAFAGKAYLS